MEKFSPFIEPLAIIAIALIAWIILHTIRKNKRRCSMACEGHGYPF
jgi:hypothetical protein